MNYYLHFAHLYNLVFIGPILLTVFLIHLKWYKGIRYQYSLTSLLQKKGKTASKHYKIIVNSLRSFILITLGFLSLQPQLVDPTSKISVDGIDIVLALDVSGSMHIQDYGDSQKSRLDIAKEEAIRFTNLRNNDAFGLVIFGKDAISRCPITSDKKIVQTIIQDLYIGIINSEGTALIGGIITAANRLKHSKSKNKIMIVLTDGEPSDDDLEPELALEVTKELGIKIYTIGIGSEKEEIMWHPLYGAITKPKVNSTLLSKLANHSGGQFFMAENGSDMRRIYETIDKLETTKHDVPLFSRFYDLIDSIGLFILIIIGIEMACSLIWFSL